MVDCSRLNILNLIKDVIKDMASGVVQTQILAYRIINLPGRDPYERGSSSSTLT